MAKKLISSVVIFLTATCSAVSAEDQNIGQLIADQVTISGLIETEAAYVDGYANESTSDVTLATAQLGAEIAATDWASGHVLFLYEEDATDGVEVDEGLITLGGSEAMPLFLTVGKMYVPFGVFESSMISDPLTLELAETNQSALQIGLNGAGYYVSAYAFNCDVDQEGDTNPDQIECLGGNLGFTHETENAEGTFEIGYLNNISDTDGLESMLQDNELVTPDKTDGLAMFGSFALGSLTFIAEYIAALDDVDYATGSLGKPEAWNFEFDYTLNVMNREAQLAFTYQSSDNLIGFLPESRIAGAFGVALSDELTAAVEYAHDEDYEIAVGGTGDGRDIVTFQLALAF